MMTDFTSDSDDKVLRNIMFAMNKFERDINLWWEVYPQT